MATITFHYTNNRDFKSLLSSCTAMQRDGNNANANGTLHGDSIPLPALYRGLAHRPSAPPLTTAEETMPLQRRRIYRKLWANGCDAQMPYDGPVLMPAFSSALALSFRNNTVNPTTHAAANGMRPLNSTYHQVQNHHQRQYYMSQDNIQMQQSSFHPYSNNSYYPGHIPMSTLSQGHFHYPVVHPHIQHSTPLSQSTFNVHPQNALSSVILFPLPPKPQVTSSIPTSTNLNHAMPVHNNLLHNLPENVTPDVSLINKENVTHPIALGNSSVKHKSNIDTVNDLQRQNYVSVSNEIPPVTSFLRPSTVTPTQQFTVSDTIPLLSSSSSSSTTTVPTQILKHKLETSVNNNELSQVKHVTTTPVLTSPAKKENTWAGRVSRSLIDSKKENTTTPTMAVDQPTIIPTTHRSLTSTPELSNLVIEQQTNKQALPLHDHLRPDSIIFTVPDIASMPTSPIHTPTVPSTNHVHCNKTNAIDITEEQVTLDASSPQLSSTPLPRKPFSSWADMLRTNTHTTSSLPSTSSTTTSLFSVNDRDSSPSRLDNNSEEESSIINHSVVHLNRHNSQTVPTRFDHFHSLADLLQNYQCSFQPELIRSRGLVNNGNMCFMNVILQPLAHCAPFYNLLLTIASKVAHSFNSTTPLTDALVMFIKEFPLHHHNKAMAITETGINDNSPVLPDYVYDALRKQTKFESMKGRQEDAEEVLGYLLDGLQDEFSAVLRPFSTTALSAPQGASVDNPTTNTVNSTAASVNSDISESGDNWLVVGVRNRTAITRSVNVAHSPISKIFGGRTRTVLRVPGKKDSIVVEPFRDLKLDIEPDHIHTLQDALKHLTRLETIEDFHRGVGKADATNQTHIETLPPILILHLKRFQFDARIGDTVKITKHVHFDTLLTLQPDLFAAGHRPSKPVEYRLFAVVNHHGSLAAGGHYTCDVMRGDNTWLRIDDTLASFIEPVDVIVEKFDREPYLLFYENTSHISRENLSTTTSPSIWNESKYGSGNEPKTARSTSTLSPTSSSLSSKSPTLKQTSRKKKSTGDSITKTMTTTVPATSTTKQDDISRKTNKRIVVGANKVNSSDTR